MRYYVETRKRLGVPATAIYKEITQAWGDEHVCRATVYNYYKEYSSDGRVDNGRPVSVRSVENVETVEKLVAGNPWLTVDEIAQNINISHGSVHRILTSDLGLKSYCCKWIPFELSDGQKAMRIEWARKWLDTFNTSDPEYFVIIDEKSWFLRTVGPKKANRCWVGDLSERSVKVKQSQFDKKLMSIVAVTFSGKFHVEILEKMKL